MTRIRTAIAVLAIALPLAAVVAGCGGSSSNNEDPQQVLHETFNNPTKITSGNLDISVDGSAEGQQSGNFSASITGPFQSDPKNETAIPQFDLTADVSGGASVGPSISFNGSLIATKDNAYVEYQDQAYEVGTAAFQQFAQAYAKAAKQNQAKGGSTGFSQFGIDPSTWLTNVSNEGTTDVEGTDSIHIHGDADLSKIVTDLQKISKQTGGTTQQVTPDQLKQLTDSVKTASVDVYSSTDDKLLSKLAISLSIAPPASAGSSVSSLDVNFSVTLSDVNSPQTITAPSNPKPLSDLLGQLGIPGLGLPGAGGTGGFSIPGGGSSGGSSSSYQNCVAQAKSQAEIQKCLQQL